MQPGSHSTARQLLPVDSERTQIDIRAGYNRTNSSNATENVRLSRRSRVQFCLDMNYLIHTIQINCWFTPQEVADGSMPVTARIRRRF